jgi:hypothetical protein
MDAERRNATAGSFPAGFGRQPRPGRQNCHRLPTETLRITGSPQPFKWASASRRKLNPRGGQRDLALQRCYGLELRFSLWLFPRGR